MADTGVGRNGQPWLMVTAGNAKVTGDVSTPLVVYKSWETGRATIDPAEAADIQRQIEADRPTPRGKRTRRGGKRRRNRPGHSGPVRPPRSMDIPTSRKRASRPTASGAAATGS